MAPPRGIRTLTALRGIILLVALSLLAILPTESAHAAAYNSNTDWLMKSKYGLFVQWLHGDNDLQGDWNTLVNGFDVNAFADQAQQVGAKYVVFTVGQGSKDWAAPSTIYDNLARQAGLPPVSPTRDLPADLADALSAKGIKLMLYFAGDVDWADPSYQAALGWNNGFTDTYRKNVMAIAKEWSDRYGSKVAGWWIDGVYARNGYGSLFPTFASDLKDGNPDSIVSFTAGNVLIGNDDPNEDYSAGEQDQVTQVPTSRWVDGMQWHEVMHLGAGWSNTGLYYPTPYLANYVKQVTDRQGVVSINPYVDKNGTIDSAQFSQLLAIDNVVSGNADYQTDVSHDDPGITYSGSWNDSHGNYTTYTATAGDSCQYAFTGSTLSLWGVTGPDHGKADVYIDGALASTIDLYASDRTDIAQIYGTSGLPDGPHTVKLVVRGDNNPSSSGHFVELAALQYNGGTRTYVDDTSPAINYSGTWGTVDFPDYYDGTGHDTTTAGSSAQYTFTGNTVALYGVRGPDHGKVDVYVDGVFADTIDAYNPARLTNTILYSATGLPNSEHTITMVERSDKNSSSSGYYSELDTLETTAG